MSWTSDIAPTWAQFGVAAQTARRTLWYFLQEVKTRIEALEAAPAGGGSAYAPSDVVTVLASGTAGQYERHPTLPTVVRLSATVYFGPDQTDPAVLPAGWTEENTAKEASSTITDGAFVFVSTAESIGTDYPARRFVLPADIGTGGVWPARTELVFKVAYGDLNEAGNIIGWYKADGVRAVVMNPCRTAGAYKVRVLYDAGGAAVPDAGIITAAQAAAWTWCRIVVGAGGAYRCEISLFDPAVTPAWVLLYQGTLADPIHSFAMQAFNSNANPVTYSVSQLVGASGYPAAPAALVLADIDAGVGSTFTPGQAALRKMLADAINREPEDAGTWTFSCVSGAAPAPAAGTYYAPAAVVSPAAARYVRVYAKCVSAGGLQSASFDTALLRDLRA